MMKTNTFRSLTLKSRFHFWATFFLGIALTSCQQDTAQSPDIAQNEATPVLEVLKDPSCGCCEGWVSHIRERGFTAQISHPENLAAEKLRRGVAPQYQSCHTAVSAEGYVFEGHIPAGLIRRFLEEMPNDAVGLAVPGMPLGSPGMEVGDQFHPYDVLVLKTDGSAEVYAHISSKEEQY